MAISRRRYTRTALALNAARFAGRKLVPYATRAMALKYQRRSQRTQSGVLTNQYNAGTIYKRRRMPRQKRYQWRRMVQKVNAINDKEYARQMTLIPYNESNAPSNPNTQAHQGFGMYTCNGTGFMGDDLAIIFNRISNGGAISVWDDYQVKFTSCVMDIFLQARSTNTNTIRVEVNYFQVTQDIPLIAGVSFRDLYAQGISSTPVQSSSTYLACSDTTPGIEPFDISKMTKYIKIYKKTEIILSPGQATSFQMRDAANHMIRGTDAARLLMLRGYRGFFYTCASFFNGTNQPGFALDTRVEKHYNYVLKEKKEQALQRTS